VASRLHDQVASCESGTRRRAVVLHKADQQTLNIRQPDGPPEASGNMRRRYSDTKPNATFRLALGQGIYLSPEGLIGWNGEVETFSQTVRIQPHQSSLGGDDRAAGRAGQQRGNVLDASGDTPATRPAETPLNTRHETQGHPQPASTWIRQSEDGSADSWRTVSPPLDR
jgi:hypothetical protein